MVAVEGASFKYRLVIFSTSNTLLQICLLCALLYSSLALPTVAIAVYIQISIILSSAFILMQHVILVDWGYTLSSSWGRRERWWLVGLLLLSLSLLIGSVAWGCRTIAQHPFESRHLMYFPHLQDLRHRCVHLLPPRIIISSHCHRHYCRRLCCRQARLHPHRRHRVHVRCTAGVVGFTRGRLLEHGRSRHWYRQLSPGLRFGGRGFAVGACRCFSVHGGCISDSRLFDRTSAAPATANV